MQKFSIILPVHNGGEYVKDCVQSILSQTLQDFNLIILDNASNDGTFEWLSSLNNEKIIVYTSDKFLSIEQNWARVKHVTKNEFISLIGHDDLLKENFLELINSAIISNPHASLYHTHFDYINAQGNVIRECRPMPYSLSGDKLLKKILSIGIDIMGTGYVVRSKDYDSINGIPLNYPGLLFADFELWLTMTFINGEVVIPENCFSFRIHQSATTASKDDKLHTALKVFVEYLSKFQQTNKEVEDIVQKYGAVFLSFYCKSFCHRLLRTTLKLRNDLTIKKTIIFFRNMAASLNISKYFKPEKKFYIQTALLIDSNILLRKAFLTAKKIYKKPFLK